MPEADEERPDNEAMRLHELHVISYLDENGEQFTTYKWVGDEPSYIHAIGMLESAKLAMHFAATHAEDDE